jgi:maleate isomerase
MPDAGGWRAKFGSIVPSTNTIVEHDFNLVPLPGITFHVGRMYIEDPRMDSNEHFEHLVRQIREAMASALRDTLTARPDWMIMGMSAETFWGGVEGNRGFEQRVRELTGGMGVSTGATSSREALELLGAQRISILSPYQPVADEMVTRFFEESGFRIMKFRGLRCPSATAIAEVRDEELIPVLHELDGPDVDAILQVGTNLSMMRLSDEAERWLGKPVIAINAAVLRHALRNSGFEDRFPGYGAILREH